LPVADLLVQRNSFLEPRSRLVVVILGFPTASPPSQDEKEEWTTWYRDDRRALRTIGGHLSVVMYACSHLSLSLPCTSSLTKLYSATTIAPVTFAVLRSCTAMLRHRHDPALTNAHNREPRIEEASRTWRVFDFRF
jgi:hypothetical protein